MNGRALVAYNLRRLRVERGISQEQLAADASMDRSYLGGLERQVENPTVDLIDRLAETLKVRPGDFFVEWPPGKTAPEPLKGGRHKKR